jgi:hypothetical protein
MGKVKSLLSGAVFDTAIEVGDTDAVPVFPSFPLNVTVHDAPIKSHFAYTVRSLLRTPFNSSFALCVHALSRYHPAKL